MERLIRELQTLQGKEDLSNARIMGALIATAVRCKDLLDTRAVGIQAMATAIGMQPEIDPHKLYEDFMLALEEHYQSKRLIPLELKDLGAIIKLAAADRQRR